MPSVLRCLVSTYLSGWCSTRSSLRRFLCFLAKPIARRLQSLLRLSCCKDLGLSACLSSLWWWVLLSWLRKGGRSEAIAVTFESTLLLFSFARCWAFSISISTMIFAKAILLRILTWATDFRMTQLRLLHWLYMMYELLPMRWSMPSSWQKRGWRTYHRDGLFACDLGHWRVLYKKSCSDLWLLSAHYTLFDAGEKSGRLITFNNVVTPKIVTLHLQRCNPNCAVLAVRLFRRASGPRQPQTGWGGYS